MAKPPQDQVLGDQNAARRKFLAQVAATGAGAVAVMPLQPQQEPVQTPKRAASPAAGSTIAEIVAQYATSIKYEDLTPDVVHMVKRVMIDTLGCAVGGYSAEPSQIAV